MALAVLVLAVASWCVPVAAQAAFPGANGKLAFVSARNGFPADNDLYTMNADGTSQTRITSLDQDELYPSWTRSGAKIVFQQDPGLHPEIRVANADGSGLQQLTSNSANDTHPAWSPYATKIVFASDRDATSGVPDLFVMNADGSNPTNITNTPAIAEDYPAWSPGGSKLAFSRDGDIYTAQPDGSSPIPLTQTPETDVEPDWSPNGGQIAYHAGLGSNDEIWKMNADGSGKANLTNNGATVDERPAWSPAGDKIAFTRDAFNDAEVYVMNADGSGQTRITNNTVMDSQPAWQPVPPAASTVTVRLNSLPDDPQDFVFRASGLDDGFTFGPPTFGPTPFTLDDDADPTLSRDKVFTEVDPGISHSVSQDAVPGWDTTSATCDDGSSPASIDVSAGENVTCTFTNRKRGQIVLVLNTVPNDPQDFSFTTGGGLAPTTVQLDDDSDGTLANTHTFSGVLPGSGYSIAQGQLPPGGWAQASATCGDGSPVSNVSVSDGETVTCTFTNHQPGHIAVVNDAQPNDAQDFGFTSGGGLSPTSFQLDDDADQALERMRVFDVPAGSGYSVSESVPSGWLLGTAACDDGSSLSNINVSPNETVICTFTNLRRGQITVVADAQPDDAQDFDFTAGGGLSPTTFQLDDDSDGTLPQTRTFSNVSPGTGYSVSGAVPPGWDQASAACSDDSFVSNIQISPGESVTCTFTNRRVGQIIVVKDAQPDDPQNFDFTTGGGLSPATFQLDDDTDPALSNTQTFASVPAGDGYSIAESAASGWVQSSGACDDGSPVSNVDVAAGETVTCTFVSQRGYPRPRGATPLTASLVPAFGECAAPNRVHGPSLAAPSCNPPSQSSPHLTVGTTDANGQVAQMVGSIKFSTVVGNPAVPADDADVTIRANVADVRLRSNTNDYVGELEGAVVLRITDRLNGAGLNEGATVSDVPFAFTIPCTGTSGTENIGSTCTVITSADAVLPGAVTEGKRSIWQMSEVRVSDGGPDGQASTLGNSPFLGQGIFVP